ncbi:MAG: hypothetical protein WC428_01675 [Candidatus Paceibacterota bacterium]|jgi:hypothetical protein
MEVYFKYKRFEIVTIEDKIQEFLDDLIKEGWQIIYYNEIVKLDNVVNSGSIISSRKIFITVVAGKKQDNTLKNIL